MILPEFQVSIAGSKSRPSPGRIAISEDEHDNIKRVIAHVSAEDSNGWPSVVVTLAMSPEKARAVAAELLRVASA